MLTEKDKNQITKFVSMIYHDDNNSNYFICTYVGGDMLSKRTSIAEFNLKQISENDCYVSLNGFTGYHRRSKECRQINGIIFDLDYHTTTTDEHLDWLKKRTTMLLKDAIDEGDLYDPNIITDTGRGLQLLYLFEKAISYKIKGGTINERAIYAYNKIRETIEKQIENVLTKEDETLEIDKKVYDLSRIIRLPGTLNSRSNTKAYIAYISEDYYTFSDFYTKQKVLPDKEKTKKIGYAQKGLYNKNALNEARLNEMEKLQLIRKDHCEGFRNFMTFIYYNSAVQLYSQKEALAKTFTFCRNFGESNTPFSEAQIKAIARGIDNNSTNDFKGFYIITKEWIIDKLSITDEEAELIGLDKTVNARELKKRENAMKKKERNDKILEMADNNVARSDIAAAVGVTKRTVQNVLKTYGKTREYNSKVKVKKIAS